MSYEICVSLILSKSQCKHKCLTIFHGHMFVLPRFKIYCMKRFQSAMHSGSLYRLIVINIKLVDCSKFM